MPGSHQASADERGRDESHEAVMNESVKGADLSLDSAAAQLVDTQGIDW